MLQEWIWWCWLSKKLPIIFNWIPSKWIMPNLLTKSKINRVHSSEIEEGEMTWNKSWVFFKVHIFFKSIIYKKLNYQFYLCIEMPFFFSYKMKYFVHKWKCYFHLVVGIDVSFHIVNGLSILCRVSGPMFWLLHFFHSLVWCYKCALSPLCAISSPHLFQKRNNNLAVLWKNNTISCS